MRTYTPKPHEVERHWYVIDATDVVLGRLASQTAILLRGKHKPTFAPHVDGGDFVVIINADKVALTGSKLAQKKAYHHSGFPGGLKATSYQELLAKAPAKAVEKAVRGMLPKNSIARQQLSKLKVAGPAASSAPVPPKGPSSKDAVKKAPAPAGHAHASSAASASVMGRPTSSTLPEGLLPELCKYVCA